MNVAVVKTGPGVTCPTATASSSCRSVSQWNRCTRSARRSARSTYPLPNSTLPTLANTPKSGQSPTLARESPPVTHHLVLHHGSVGRRAAEGDGTELEKQLSQLDEGGPFGVR